MAKFVISPHFRLQEWVAEEKVYFAAEGLDYEFRDNYGAGDIAKKHTMPDKVGAFQSFEQGRACDVSGACHWTVNIAASTGHGKLYADAYSVSPAAVFVPPESAIREPADLKGVPISVGYQSGSHYATIQALEQYMPLEEIKLSFADGLLFRRMELLIDRKVPAASLFSGPYSTRITTARSFRRGSSRRWTRAAGDRASASCSSPTPGKCSRNRSTGSPNTTSFPRAKWAPGDTRIRWSRCRAESPLSGYMAYAAGRIGASLFAPSQSHAAASCARSKRFTWAWMKWSAMDGMIAATPPSTTTATFSICRWWSLTNFR